MLRDTARNALTVLLVAVAITLVVGQLLGQPMLLGFVTTGSMQPALDPGDGFVAIPSQVGGDVSEGDVVVFEAEELHGGGLTTHRVVGETEEGYVTKGDANPFTDQDGGEPPVTDEQIVATALQVNGNVIAIPNLGTAVIGVREAILSGQAAIASALGGGALLGARGAGLFVFGLGLILFVATFVVERRRGETRSRERSRRRDVMFDGRLLAVALVAIVLLPANVAMIGPTDTHQITADGDDVADHVEPGETIESELTASNDGLVTMLIVLEVEEGVTVSPSELELSPGASSTATLSLPAPPPGETRTVHVSEHRYFLLLPSSVLLPLHEISPILAWGLINVLLTVSVLGFVEGLVGLGRTRVRDTSRSVPLRRRLRNLFR